MEQERNEKATPQHSRLNNDREIIFGDWVVVDENQADQRQIIDYYVLNDKYHLDKEGVWQWIDGNRVLFPDELKAKNGLDQTN